MALKEEGDCCGVPGCTGEMVLAYPDGGCSCHINPPCSRCTSSYLACSVCHWTEEDAISTDTPPAADAPLADALRQAGAFTEPDLGKSQAQIEAEALARNRAIFAKGVF